VPLAGRVRRTGAPREARLLSIYAVPSFLPETFGLSGIEVARQRCSFLERLNADAFDVIPPEKRPSHLQAHAAGQDFGRLSTTMITEVGKA